MKFQADELLLYDSTKLWGSSVEVTATSPGRGSQGTRISRKPSPLGTCQFIDKYVIKGKNNLNTATCAVTVIQSDIKIYYLEFPSVRHGLMQPTPKQYKNSLCGLKRFARQFLTAGNQEPQRYLLLKCTAA